MSDIFKNMSPMEIEKRSFEIIESELTTNIPEDIKPVVKRVIHTERTSARYRKND